MNENERSAVKNLLSKIGVINGREITKPLFDIWVDCLEGKSAAQIEGATIEFIKGWNGYGFPRPSDFLPYIGQIQNKMALDQFEEIGRSYEYENLSKEQVDRLSERKRARFFEKFSNLKKGINE